MHQSLVAYLKRFNLEEKSQDPDWQALLAAVSADYDETEARILEGVAATAHGMLASSLTSIPVGLILTTTAGSVSYTNPAAQRILGTFIVPSSVSDLAAYLQPEVIDAIATVSREHRTVKFEQVQSGSSIVSIFLAPVVVYSPAEECVGTVILLEDRTQQVALERSKDEFFSIASHELRTPLTAIRGNASMLLDHFDDCVQDNSAPAMIADIHEGSIRLITIVNDFLDVSRIEQGKLTYVIANHDVCRILKSAIEEITPTLQSGVRLLTQGLDQPLLCAVDPDKFREIVINIVGNAMKFTSEGTITVSTDTTSASQLTIRIADTGRGIGEDGKNRLFHKFQQTASSLYTRDTTKGTGLGLYIAKKMAQGMQGDVVLESSAEGIGSTFAIVLPRSNP